MKRKTKPPPNVWWRDMDGNTTSQLTWREWMECVRLFKVGAKYGLYHPPKKVKSGYGLRSLTREVSPQSSDVAPEDGPAL